MTLGSGTRLGKVAASLCGTRLNTRLAYATVVSAIAKILSQCL